MHSYYIAPVLCNYYRYILPIDYSDLYTQTCDVNKDDKNITIPNCEGYSYLNSIASPSITLSYSPIYCLTHEPTMLISKIVLFLYSTFIYFIYVLYYY